MEQEQKQLGLEQPPIAYPQEYAILFESELFTKLGKGQCRMLYHELSLNLPASMRADSKIYRHWFVHPAQVLKFDNSEQLLKAMKKAFINVSTLVVAEFDALQAHIDVYKPIFLKAIENEQKSI